MLELERGLSIEGSASVGGLGLPRVELECEVSVNAVHTTTCSSSTLASPTWESMAVTMSAVASVRRRKILVVLAFSSVCTPRATESGLALLETLV